MSIAQHALNKLSLPTLLALEGAVAARIRVKRAADVRADFRDLVERAGLSHHEALAILNAPSRKSVGGCRGLSGKSVSAS